MSTFAFDQITLRHAQGYVAQMPLPFLSAHTLGFPPALADSFSNGMEPVKDPLHVPLSLDAQTLTCFEPHTIPLDPQAALVALQSDATAVRIMDKHVTLLEGNYVGVRLNLNVLKNTGIAVQSIHARLDSKTPFDPPKDCSRGLFDAPVCSYAPVVVLRNAHFCVNQNARHNIATGQSNKFPMASIDGFFEPFTPSQPDAHQAVFQGVAVRFNPVEHHLFVDPNGLALAFAERVVIVGHRAYASGALRYHHSTDVPVPLAASKTRFLDQLFTTPTMAHVQDASGANLPVRSVLTL